MKNVLLQRRKHKVFQKKIDDIMENFDFYKVHHAMSLLNWVWINSGGVPSIDDIKKNSLRLLNEVVRHDENTIQISSGGLRADKIDGNYLELSFVLEYWEALD